MSRLNELLGGDEETLGPGIDLVFSICAILLIVLALVVQLYRGSSSASLYLQSELQHDRDEIKKKQTHWQNEIRALMLQLSECNRQKALQNESESHGEQLRTQFGELINRAAVVLEGLKKDLETEDFPIAVEYRPDRLYFDMGVYFPFDSADPKDIPTDQQARIHVIGDTFRRILDQRIRVGTDMRQARSVMRVVIEGHTDDKRPARDHFVNYHFAKERAFAVMKLLMKKSKLIPPEYRISIAGYAEYGRPPNLDPSKNYDPEVMRGKMRRVTISIAPDYDVLK